MNTEQLKCFLSVANHLNFTKAAKEFYVSQPAISHQISELENELGIKLFHRNTRNVTLTRAGEIFIEDAKKFIEFESLSKGKLRTLETAKNLHLNLGYLSACTFFLPDVINEFHKAYPEVEVSLTRHDAKEIQSSLEVRQFDIYFSLMEDLLNQKEYECRKLYSEQYCLVCRHDHPCLNGDGSYIPKLIADEPFLMHSKEKAFFLVKQVIHICKEINYTPIITQHFNSMEELLFAVSSGIGITIVPENLSKYLSSDLTYIKLKDTITYTAMGVAWIGNNENPAITWFMEILARFVNENPEIFS